MEIRRVTDLEADLVQVLYGMRDFISRMDYQEFLPEDDSELILSLNRLMETGMMDIIVAEDEGHLVGGIGMFYAPCIWNSNLLVGEELFWWTHRRASTTTALRLLRAVKEEAVRRDCKMVNFKSLTSSPDGVDRVYRKMGFVPAETTYLGMVETWR